jgi:uncharacterized protein YjbJ (UPF0337 family)
MSWDALQGDRDLARENLKREWGKLTDADIAIVMERREQLERLLEKYYGYDQVKSQSEVDRWLRQF